ncbi:hypothetical protein BDR22DRAFT_820155 [Usnea florida]
MAGRWVSDTSPDPNVTWRSQRHLPHNVIQNANYAQFYGFLPLQERAVIILGGMEYGSKDVDCHVNRTSSLDVGPGATERSTSDSSSSEEDRPDRIDTGLSKRSNRGRQSTLDVKKELRSVDKIGIIASIGKNEVEQANSSVGKARCESYDGSPRCKGS